ncbi:MAG: OmpA family protein [Sphingobacteriales bacterium]|nr:OmpA family protein [Sphingobacteriales bacterium]
MKTIRLFLVQLLFALPFTSFSQTTPIQDASIPKDAQVDVTITDFKDVPLPHEIMMFRSKNYDKEYSALTNDSGKFSTRLPAGDVYSIFILGFKDSVSIDSLVIPGLQGKQYYKNPFVVNYQFQPSKSFVLENCNFDNGKATLQESAFPVLDELVAYMKRKEDDRIELGGHTDNVGSAASNIKLSADRANTVKAYLVASGINETRIVTKGYGSSKPISDNKTADGRAENRRTEVTILENK